MEGSGRDPLGLSRVSDALTNFPLPNIITSTELSDGHALAVASTVVAHRERCGGFWATTFESMTCRPPLIKRATRSAEVDAVLPLADK